MAVRLAADLRPSADGSAVRTPLVAGGGKAAGSLRAAAADTVPKAAARLGQLRPGTDGQTDGRIAESLNAPPPLRRGHTNCRIRQFCSHRLYNCVYLLQRL